MPTNFEVKLEKSRSRRPGVYRFGEFQIDAADGSLRRNGLKVGLNRRAFDVLRLLVERSGEVVTKQEFFDIVWADTFVEDNSLTVAMTTLRKVLGDDAKNAKFIENLPRRGYRFIAEVREVDPAGISITNSTIEKPEESENYLGLRKKKFLSGLLATCLVCLLIGLGFTYFRASRPDQTSAASAQSPKVGSIAVMPFENSNPELEYLSDGLVDSIIANLAPLQDLRVINRNSVLQYKNRPFDLVETGRTLGVDSILTGRFDQDGDNLVITAELTDLIANKTIWTQRYEQKLTNELEIQNDISQQIAAMLRTGTSVGEPQLTKHQTDDPEAFRLYLKGRHHLNRRTEDGFEKALKLFRQAIEKDPTFARAYVGEANCYAMGGFRFLGATETRAAMVDATVQKALEIDDELSDAHAVRGLNKAYYLWDWAGAETSYKRAIELDPSNASAYHWYAEYLAIHSRFDESFDNYQRAQKIDPLSLPIAADWAYTYVYSGQLDEAMARLQALKERDPKFARIYSNIADIYHQKGMVAEALLESKGYFSILENGEGLQKIAILEDALERTGPRGFWQKTFEVFAGDPNFSTVGAALFHLRLGDRDQTFKLLERAYANREAPIVYINIRPEFAELRTDNRFVDLIRRIGLSSK